MKPLVTFKRQASTELWSQNLYCSGLKGEEKVKKLGHEMLTTLTKFGHEEKERKVWVAGWKCVWLKQGVLFLGFMKGLEN